MDTLPVEILGVIAGISEQSYHSIALSMRLFAIGLTPGVIIDWQIHFNHTVTITADKISWRRHGAKHRIGGPAVTFSTSISTPNGVEIADTQYWYRNGEKHRIGGPAVIFPGGAQYWYRNNKLHRDGGPAVIYPGGTHTWYHNGVLYSDNGPSLSDVGFWFDVAQW